MGAPNEQEGEPEGAPPDGSRSAFAVGLVLALCLGAWAYAPTLALGYYADDFPLIAGADRKLAEPGGWGIVLEFLRPRPETHGAKFYRPLWEASFALDAALGADARTSHALNLGLHLITSALVAGLGLALGLRRAGALAAAACFACFPAHHEVVGWVCARSSSLAALFLCASLLATAHGAGRRNERAWQVVAVLALALALASKDTALVYPGFVLPMIALQARARGEPLWKSLAERALPLLAAFGLLFLGRWWVLGEPIGGYDVYPRELATPAAAWSSFASLSRAWTWPLSELAPTAAIPLALVLLGLLGATLLREGRIAAVFALGLLWSWLGLAPVFGYLQRGFDSVDTRYFYLPSLGTALVWGALFAWIAGRANRSAHATALVLLAGLAGAEAFALRLHLRAYEPGERSVRALVDQAADLGRAHPEAALLVFGIESAIGPVYGNAVVFPSAMSPTFADVPAPERYHGFGDDPERWAPDEWMTALLLLDPSTPRVAWDRDAQRIAEVDWPIPPGPENRAAPQLVRDPGGARGWSVELSIPGAPLALLAGRERGELPFGPAGTIRVAEPEVLFLAVEPGVERYELQVPPGAFEQGAWLQVLLPTPEGAQLTDVVRVLPGES